MSINPLDPWDERSIYLHDWLILYGKLVGHYTVRPTDPMGNTIQSTLNSNMPFKRFQCGDFAHGDFCS